MKNSLLILFFSVIALLTCLTSCQKDDTSNPPLPDELPPITQTGEQTFGCLLNGEVWVPKHYSNSIVNPPVVLQASKWGNILNVIASRHPKNDDIPKQILGLYTLVDKIQDTIMFGYDETGTRFLYERDPPKSGGVYKVYKSVENPNSWLYLLRFDTISRIASGTFSFDLLNTDNNLDTVRIREGRFDVRF